MEKRTTRREFLKKAAGWTAAGAAAIGAPIAAFEFSKPYLERAAQPKQRLQPTLEDHAAVLVDINPQRNYKETLERLQEANEFYDNPGIATAAIIHDDLYGSRNDHFGPRDALCQRQLNYLYNNALLTQGKDGGIISGEDGLIGPDTREVVKKFQKEYGLEADGLIGPETYAKLQEVWEEKGSPNALPEGKGIIPNTSQMAENMRVFGQKLNKYMIGKNAR